MPSPGRTHTERAKLVAGALADLAERGLASGDRATPELADRLALLAYPQLSIDGWVWTDHRISSLARGLRDHRAAGGRRRAGGLADPRAGDGHRRGHGRHRRRHPARARLLGDHADRHPQGSRPGVPRRPAGVRGRPRPGGIPSSDAKTMADMVAGMGVRGQFGASRLLRDQRMVRADRVVAFHDTDRGRYVYLAKPNADGRSGARSPRPTTDASRSACGNCSTRSRVGGTARHGESSDVRKQGVDSAHVQHRRRSTAACRRHRTTRRSSARSPTPSPRCAERRLPTARCRVRPALSSAVDALNDVMHDELAAAENRLEGVAARTGRDLPYRPEHRARGQRLGGLGTAGLGGDQ